MAKRICAVLMLLSGFMFAVNINAEQIGDMNADGQVDTTEAIISLKVAAGQDPGVPLGTYIPATGDAVAADVLSGKTFSNSSAANITGTMPPVARALGCLPGVNLWIPDQCQLDCDAIASYNMYDQSLLTFCHNICSQTMEMIIQFNNAQPMVCSVPPET